MCPIFDSFDLSCSKNPLRKFIGLPKSIEFHYEIPKLSPDIMSVVEINTEADEFKDFASKSDFLDNL